MLCFYHLQRGSPHCLPSAFGQQCEAASALGQKDGPNDSSSPFKDPFSKDDVIKTHPKVRFPSLPQEGLYSLTPHVCLNHFPRSREEKGGREGVRKGGREGGRKGGGGKEAGGKEGRRRGRKEGGRKEGEKPCFSVS